MSLLNNEQINDELNNMDGWVYKDNKICKSYHFESYMDGINFVNILAKKAEELNHHPDLIIGWREVSVSFTSHDKGGVTSACLKMAKTVEEL